MCSSAGRNSLKSRALRAARQASSPRLSARAMSRASASGRAVARRTCRRTSSTERRWRGDRSLRLRCNDSTSFTSFGSVVRSCSTPAMAARLWARASAPPGGMTTS